MFQTTDAIGIPNHLGDLAQLLCQLPVHGHYGLRLQTAAFDDRHRDLICRSRRCFNLRRGCLLDGINRLPCRTVDSITKEAKPPNQRADRLAVLLLQLSPQ